MSISQTFKSNIDALERSGYIPEYKRLLKSFCVPIWWAAKDASGEYHALQNGTVVFLRTPKRLLAVTAGHVYRKYLSDKAEKDVVCQFGNATILPEERLIDVHHRVDIATFDISDVILAACGGFAHEPIAWPLNETDLGTVGLCGGFPQVLRKEGLGQIETGFQTLIGAVIDVTNVSIVFNSDPTIQYWPQNPEVSPNADLGGMSGGPLFRFIPAPPALVERIELAGFIYDVQPAFNALRAHPLHLIDADGLIISI